MRGIKKDFFGNQVLTDINFTLGAGQVLGLCGENGAGKSTLMKILFGMDVIRETGGYSGDILIGGAEDYDDRGWNNNVSARERLFALALEALCKL